MKQILVYILVFSGLTISAQNTESPKVFTYENYLTLVRQNHPIIQQVNLLEAQANAQLLKAKGNFDPKLEAEHQHKQFSNKNYFRATELGLKIPTWWGADVKVAYNWANGDFLNPENNLPQNGQAIIGVEIPLLNGLLFDKRREQVQQAKLLKNLNEIERQKIINNFMLSAIESYWNWVYAYKEYETYNNFKNLAQNRFELTKQSFLQGMKPAIDTLESYIQLQNRTLAEQQAKQNFRNNGLELSVFLWNENTEPLEMEENLIPNKIENLVFENNNTTFSNWENSINNHPEIRLLETQTQQLELKEKLKKEGLKPNLSVNYNFLGNGFDLVNPYLGEGVGESIFTNNYKWGVQFSYPLLLRKTRGDLQLIALKQKDLNYKRIYKKQSINNKAQSILEQLTLTRNQLIEQEKIVANYQSLLNAENVKFKIGESSIFLLNNREQKLIDAQLKQFKQIVLLNKLNEKLNNALGLIK